MQTLAAFSTNVLDIDFAVTPAGTLATQDVWMRSARAREDNSQATEVTLVSQRSDWLVQALQNLNRMSQLGLDWDSYGGEPPNQRATDLARSVLCFLAEVDFEPTSLDPSSEGGVCISFRNSNWYGDIECFNSGEVLAVISRGGEDTTVWELARLEEGLEPTVNRIRSFLEQPTSRDA